MQLNVYSYGIVMRKRNDNGSISEFAIDPADISRAFATKQELSTGFLTPNTLYVGTDGQRTIVAEYRPPERVGIFIEGAEQPVRVPLPGLLMVRAAVGKSPYYGIYAVKERPNAFTAQLFRPPLPNMHSGGSVCWGNVKKVSKKALEGVNLAKDWELYLGSTFTAHAVGDKSKKHKGDIRQMLFEVERQGLEAWPADDLVADITLDKALERVKRGL